MLTLRDVNLDRRQTRSELFDVGLECLDHPSNSLSLAVNADLASCLVESQFDIASLSSGDEDGTTSNDKWQDVGRDVLDTLGRLGRLLSDDLFE